MLTPPIDVVVFFGENSQTRNQTLLREDERLVEGFGDVLLVAAGLAHRGHGEGAAGGERRRGLAEEERGGSGGAHRSCGLELGGGGADEGRVPELLGFGAGLGFGERTRRTSLCHRWRNRIRLGSRILSVDGESFLKCLRFGKFLGTRRSQERFGL